MSGTITAAVAAVATAYIGYEQNRGARAAQREQKTAIKLEQDKINAETEWEKKKKGEQDILNSRLALRFRGDNQVAQGMSGGMGSTGLSAPLNSSLSDKLGL